MFYNNQKLWWRICFYLQTEATYVNFINYVNYFILLSIHNLFLNPYNMYGNRSYLFVIHSFLLSIFITIHTIKCISYHLIRKQWKINYTQIWCSNELNLSAHVRTSDFNKSIYNVACVLRSNPLTVYYLGY